MRFHRTAATALTLLALAACSSGDVSVRNGPQVVHPSPSALAQGRSFTAGQMTNAQAPTSVDELFDSFCRGKSSAAQSEAALKASGRFAAPRVTEFGSGASRYVAYDLTDGTRGGVTVTYGTGIQCAAGVENKGITLFENGRITRS